MRPNGISVLIACQNEEATLALCVTSFLDFADEIIIVDNGSRDQTITIAETLQADYASLVRFYNAPHLTDLYQNRQYALERARFRWIVRGDADFVAYTGGPFDIAAVRALLLAQPRGLLPKVYGAPLPNVACDFWHTGCEFAEQPGPNDPGRYVPPPLTAPNPRIYEAFPGFRFKRVGRWEATSFHRLVWRLRKKLPNPLWMHCNLKSDLDYLFRSQRTNWRQAGDFKTYPTLETYIRAHARRLYSTDDLEAAAAEHMQTHIYPFLQLYDPDVVYPYPALVQAQMAVNPIYRLARQPDGQFTRTYSGPSAVGAPPGAGAPGAGAPGAGAPGAGAPQ